MSEKKTKKAPAKKAPAKKPAKKAPAKKKAPVKKVAKKAVKKTPVKRAPKKAPEVVQVPEASQAPEVVESQSDPEPPSMRTLLNEAFMYPSQRKQFVGGTDGCRGFGSAKLSAKTPSMANGNFRRKMSVEQIDRTTVKLKLALEQVKYTIKEAENLLASLAVETEAVYKMKKEVEEKAAKLNPAASMVGTAEDLAQQVKKICDELISETK